MVLRLVDQGDRHRIVSLYTPDAGRTSAIARFARGSKKRFGGHLDLFNRGEAHLKSRRVGDLAALNAFSLRDGYMGIRSDVTRFATAAFFIDVVLASTAEGDANPEQYALLVHFLEALDQSEAGTRRDLILGFQLRWFHLMGELPPLNGDALAEARLPYMEEQPLAIARALLADVPIPDLDAARFAAVGVLTRIIRNRIVRRPLESTRFLLEMLDDD